MDLRTYLLVLRKGAWLLVLCSLLGLAAAAAYNALATRTYVSSVSFYVSTPTEASGGNAYQANQYALSKIKSYTELLTSDRLADMVVEDSGVNLNVPQVASRISASSELDSVILTATVTDTDAQRSLQIARSVARTFGQLVSELDNRQSTPLGSGGATVELNVTSGPRLHSGAVSPKIKLNLALGLGAGLLLGVALAFARQLLDTTIRSAESLRELTGQPVLATIGFDRRAGSNPLASSLSPSVSEAFRQLRTNLKFIELTSPLRAVAITSALPGEGKSMTAANLAQAFAQVGERVLLVEADLRRPGITQRLGRENLIGLTDVLMGTVELDDALQPGGDGEFALMPSGTIPPNPSELLGSALMLELMESLRERFDLLVLDTPPVLPVTDAGIIAQYVDSVVLVVRHGRTRRARISAALEAMENLGAPVVGTVLNAAPVRGLRDRAYEQYHAAPHRRFLVR